MKFSFLLSVALSGWIALFYSQRVFLNKEFSSLAINSLFQLSNRKSRQTQKFKIRQINIQSLINQQLYNSISEGMSYDEVRSIIGWDGVLIYKNNINLGDTHINEKIYQWNNQDIYANNYNAQNVGDINPYWSVTLQFQNNNLIGKSYYNLR
ncbi:MAG: hypothetical protein KI793_20900 [Rivularia sp. (in: Bacteria)]|nr:hypothetical protein [Rivularia sp. MS3]